jgi:hypothetical protein
MNPTLSLYDLDMRRIGAEMADIFCHALSGGSKYFEEDAEARVIENAA